MPPPKKNPQGPPEDVLAIRRQSRAFLDTPGPNGKKIGGAIWGVYAFYDYDGEPIYVGQTYESLQERISRHLTNQRSDAVAMNVLDPFEVADIEVWPLWEFQQINGKHLAFKETKRKLDATEYTVFQLVLSHSTFKAVLNEGVMKATDTVGLPPSVRGRIIPDQLYEQRRHPDVRIARRATTISALARVISERNLRRPGLRLTLLTQATRLQRLAALRYTETKGLIPTVDETGDED